MLLTDLAPPSLGCASRLTASPVRVCFMIDRLGRAGTESQLLALIRGLDRRRVRPSLVLLDGTDAESRALEPADCPILRLGVTRLTSRSALRAASRLAGFWGEHKPDVLQVYFLDSAYFGVPLARWCGVRKVVRVRNNLGYWLTRKHGVLNRVVSRLADVTLTNSDAGRDALVAAEGLRADRVAVLENGVDLERFAKTTPLPGPLPEAERGRKSDSGSPLCLGEGFLRSTIRIGCVANLRPVKNIDGFLRAAKLVADRFPHVRFEVAGGGPDRAALESLRAELGLADRFTFRGSVSDVPEFLRELDIAVLPSHSEGMSNAVLEYMAAGKAIVATDVGANANLLGDGQYGRLVPAGDTSALAVAIGELVADPDAVRTLGQAARARVEAEFSRAAMVRRFEQFYGKLTGK